ncbi:MAG: SMC-Scp complex subunit ScpB [Myxococcota bacterium]
MSKRKQARFWRQAWQQLQRASREMTREHLEGCIEALVFAARQPMTVRDLARVTSARRQDVETILAELCRHYAARGIHLTESHRGWAFASNPRYGEEVRMVTGHKPTRMSRAQLETLAIVAYRQPITRPEVDEVRGVDSGPVLRTLLDRELVRVLGKKEEPGRPLLYGTSESFLELMNLKSLGDLPTLREFTELSDDSRDTYERRLGESAPQGSIVFDDEPDAPIDPTVPTEEERAAEAAREAAAPSPEDAAGAVPGEDPAPDDGGLDDGTPTTALDDEDEPLDDDLDDVMEPDVEPDADLPSTPPPPS